MQYVTQVSLFFPVRPSKVLFEPNLCTFSTQPQQFVFSATHMRFEISVNFLRSATYLLSSLEPRVNLNGKMLETALLDPDKGNTVKDMHY